MCIADRFCPGRRQPAGTPSNIFVGRCGGDEPPFWHKKERSGPRVPARSISGTQSGTSLEPLRIRIQSSGLLCTDRDGQANPLCSDLPSCTSVIMILNRGLVLQLLILGCLPPLRQPLCPSRLAIAATQQTLTCAGRMPVPSRLFDMQGYSML